MLETDTVPLGCLDPLEVVPRAPLPMAPGDIFVALSDGVVDAANAAGQRFGVEGVIDVITRRRESSAAELATALREALVAFTGGAPADDDRTAVIVKRG